MKIIKVRDGGSNTYTARCEGKVASCTAGPLAAALAVAEKVFGEDPIASLEEIDVPERGRYLFKAWEAGDRVDAVVNT
ncbi:MAG: hypothetical protein AB1585_10690 [Thermodesulfobacteriota bacterium]